MRFGVCCALGEARDVLAAGFDYVELPAVEIGRPETDLAPYRDLPVEATNLFFPSEIRLGSTPYRDTMARTIERAASVGVQVMVIGSGGSRRRAEGASQDEAESIFLKVAEEAQRLATPFGIQIAPESLNRRETDVGNDLTTLARNLADRGVGYTADSYHVLVEWTENGGQGSPSADLWKEQLPLRPTHVHLADLPRNTPRRDDPSVLGFARRLRELGYDGRVSLECRRDLPLADALAELRIIFRR